MIKLLAAVEIRMSCSSIDGETKAYMARTPSMTKPRSFKAGALEETLKRLGVTSEFF